MCSEVPDNLRFTLIIFMLSYTPHSGDKVIWLFFYENLLGCFSYWTLSFSASADVGFAVWDRYSSEDKNPPVGYVAHLTGALAGLSIGLIVLKNFEQKLHSQVMWWVALAVYGACLLFAVVWNVFHWY